MTLCSRGFVTELANFRIVFLVFVRRLTIVFLRHDSAKSQVCFDYAECSRYSTKLIVTEEDN